MIRFLIYCFFIFTTTSAIAQNELDGIAAVINDHVITQTELDKNFQIAKIQLTQRHQQLPPDAVLRKQVLNQMVSVELQLQKAQQDDISPDDATVAAALQATAQQYNISITQLHDPNVTGMHFEDLKRSIIDQLTINEVQQRNIANKISITEAEIESFQNQQASPADQTEYHVKNILITLPDAPSSAQVLAAKQKAQTIIKQLNNDANLQFSTKAIASSNDYNALRGGDLGWRKLNELPDLFATAIKSMKLGDIAGPIRASNGYHIIKLDSIKNSAKSYVTETQASHILIKHKSNLTDNEMQKQASAIRKQIIDAPSFRRAAKRYSQDQRTAERGGNLGWLRPGDSEPAIDRALRQLKVGQISQPIKTRYGWHIIQVDAKRNIDNTEQMLKARARQALFRKKFEKNAQAWLRKLKNEAYIKTLS